MPKSRRCVPCNAPRPTQRRFVARRSLHGRPGSRPISGADGPAGYGAGSAHALRGRAAVGTPGIALPWPEDEYLRDGGNDGHAVGPGRNGEVVGLHMEDTVAQYETLNHCKVVQPSNEVYIYSPRFGAVRQVVSLVAAEERQKAGGVHEPLQPQAPTTTQLVYDTKQNVQLDDQIMLGPPRPCA